MKKFLPLFLLAFTPLLVGFVISDEGKIETPKASTKVIEDGAYQIDAQASTLYWEAFKPIGGHMGGIALSGGELIIQEGEPKHGSFLIDMTSMTCTDIEDRSTQMQVINHLKSDDFFSVADYPEARFDITRILPYQGEGDYNYEIEGDLSLKGQTHPVTVLANIQASKDRVTTFARAEVDRTKFGIITKSGSFFEGLGDKLIDDVFVIEMDLVADRMEKAL